MGWVRGIIGLLVFPGMFGGTKKYRGLKLRLHLMRQGECEYISAREVEPASNRRSPLRRAQDAGADSVRTEDGEDAEELSSR